MNLPAVFVFGLAGLVLMSAPAASAPAASTSAAGQGNCPGLDNCKMYCDVYEMDDGCPICQCATDDQPHGPTENEINEELGYTTVCDDGNKENCDEILVGDMLMNRSEAEELFGEGTDDRASIKGGRWPKNIPYVIESSIGSGGRSAIANAIENYHKYTCLRFHKRSTERSYISFYKGRGCSSPVGYRSGRVNRVSLASGCWRTGIVMHEIGHSIGLYHEQSRPDRDNYVRILTHNIESGMAYNFNKFSTRTIDSLGTPYDFRSMMHYGSNAFGGRRMTIQTKNPANQRLIGQRGGFSEIDIKQIGLMYNCGNGGGGAPATVPPPTNPPANCKNYHSRCDEWAQRDPASECLKNPQYMLRWCMKACGVCGDACFDWHPSCAGWAGDGECEKNPESMKKNCKKSCKVCG